MKLADNAAIQWYDSLLDKLYQAAAEARPFDYFLHHLCQCTGVQYAALAIDAGLGVDSGNYFAGCAQPATPLPDGLRAATLALRKFALAPECPLGAAFALDDVIARQPELGTRYF